MLSIGPAMDGCGLAGLWPVTPARNTPAKPSVLIVCSDRGSDGPEDRDPAPDIRESGADRRQDRGLLGDLAP